MIMFKLSVRRGSALYGGVNADTVRQYKTGLEEVLASMKYYGTPEPLRPNSEWADTVRATLQNEIKLCDFYLEYEVSKKAEGFNEWVMTKPEDRADLSDWNVSRHNEALVKRDGRRMAIIEVNTKRGVRKRVSLEIYNNSNVLDFVRKQGEVEYKHLSSDKSVNAYVDVLMAKAEAIMSDPLPLYEGRGHEKLLQLLQVVE